MLVGTSAITLICVCVCNSYMSGPHLYELSVFIRPTNDVTEIITESKRIHCWLYSNFQLFTTVVIMCVVFNKREHSVIKLIIKTKQLGI